MFWLIAIIIVILIYILFEYRLRKPDQLVLYEVNDKIGKRKTKFYPRHFSLVLPKTTYSSEIDIDATAKGSLEIKVKLNLVASLSEKNIDSLIKVGGWNKNAVSKSVKEFESIIESLVKDYTDKFEIEELSSEKIQNYISEKLEISKEKYGIEIISISVKSFEIVDSKIADAIRQQESARILEQTELLNQKARITAAKAKLKADEEIVLMENELELKKLELKQRELEKESQLADKKTEEELKRKKLNLEYEKAELEMLKNNPELLLLSPQAAKLAEASQSLKNARTVVNVSPNEISQGVDLISLFQNFLENTFKKSEHKKDKQ
ncbi:MAG: hypothetical protein AB1695_10790 [Stygiobacter sp.]|jgi:hypothetical protein|uniref:Band 7 domain-containing protein n=1 Tax=Stygiobacter electus TaxID=3032292 RepID=A0AAE3P0Y6_9BACT|nr:hypothetical protein [Stygiobacter electus]MDF1612084.1 hypothetical protein [Stygiobacter electus]